MAYGVDNNIGIGNAQVLPKGSSMNAFVQQLNEQKQYKDQQDRYKQQVKERDEKELYNLVGDTLNLRDFNPIIHDKVRKAQVALAGKIKSQGLSYADTYLAAQNMAGELGQTSQALNQLDQQLAATKKEYEGDKRLNSAAIETIARKKILDQLNATGKVDPSVNYFDEALNEHPEFALTDKSDYTLTDFIPEEKQSLSGKSTERSKVGRTQKFDWKAENYPVYYDFKDNGEDKSPTISTRSQPSGIKDANGSEVPMLSDDAYGRFKAKPSNVVALNLRIKKMYGPSIDLKSEEAEKLRKVEAYKDVERQKPRINKTVSDQAPLPPRISIHIGNGNGETQIRDVYGEISGKIKNSGKQLPFGLGIGIEMNQLSATAQTKVLEHANKLIGSGMTQSDIALVQTPDGVINMVDPVEGKVIAPIDFGDINIGAQPGIKEKRKVIEQTNKTYEHKGKKYTHDQVEKAAQKSGMSVDDYIKKAGLK